MKKILAALVGITVIAALIWYADAQRGAAPASAGDQTPNPYQLEAQDVVLQQMDSNGQVQYEVEAEQIALLPDNGGVMASSLTLYHDPPGTKPGSPQRWTGTAREARLPNDGRIVNLSGAVRARGLPAGARNPILLATEELRFNMDTQEVFADGEVEYTRGSSYFRGRGLKADIETGKVTLELGLDGKISL